MSATEPEPAEGGDLPQELPTDIDLDEVAPVTPTRLVEWMKRNKQRYLVGGDGHVAGVWNACVITFSISGQGSVLQMRGQWNRVVAIERREELFGQFNTRHARTAWPKCLLMVLDDGSMRVAVDHSTLVRHGLSERQLDRALRVGLASILTVFKELGERYPDPLSSAPENLT